MFHVTLFEPEIAGNAGNIARSCLAAGAKLHLVRPLGFRISDEAVRRAGMDYWEEVDITLHPSFAAFQNRFTTSLETNRVFAFTTKATQRYTDVAYQSGDVLLFGPESRGLPEVVREQTRQVRIPMQSAARSLNLSVSVGIALYEAWRQVNFKF